jgi:hypothetical protein
LEIIQQHTHRPTHQPVAIRTQRERPIRLPQIQLQPKNHLNRKPIPKHQLGTSKSKIHNQEQISSFPNNKIPLGQPFTEEHKPQKISNHQSTTIPKAKVNMKIDQLKIKMKLTMRKRNLCWAYQSWPSARLWWKHGQLCQSPVHEHFSLTLSFFLWVTYHLSWKL